MFVCVYVCLRCWKQPVKTFEPLAKKRFGSKYEKSIFLGNYYQSVANNVLNEEERHSAENSGIPVENSLDWISISFTDKLA